MRVLISGAGIAGLSLALRLRQQGLAPVVVERSPGLRDGGYMLGLSDPASTRRIGWVVLADYDERSYCLIQTCSRAGGPLPHADAPQALPVRPRCLTALLPSVLLVPEYQFPCLLRAPDLQPPLQRTQLRLARTASLLRTQPPQ